jgi:hypothetical protein
MSTVEICAELLLPRRPQAGKKSCQKKLNKRDIQAKKRQTDRPSRFELEIEFFFALERGGFFGQTYASSIGNVQLNIQLKKKLSIS